ncbi:uncharacterized protein LOC133121283 [Conger conger]|uniref:uncharacterized protein LOC133121283 n=1 Tax=Conger conger TaxID=82655 RepID=UPI002A5A0022|nr:uncharacterized protein LOC133121283 [Conger conger]
MGEGSDFSPTLPSLTNRTFPIKKCFTCTVHSCTFCCLAEIFQPAGTPVYFSLLEPLSISACWNPCLFQPAGTTVYFSLLEPLSISACWNHCLFQPAGTTVYFNLLEPLSISISACWSHRLFLFQPAGNPVYFSLLKPLPISACWNPCLFQPAETTAYFSLLEPLSGPISLAVHYPKTASGSSPRFSEGTATHSIQSLKLVWLAPPSSCVHGVSGALHLPAQGGQEELQQGSRPQVFSEARPTCGDSLAALPKVTGAEEGPRQTMEESSYPFMFKVSLNDNHIR